MTPEQADTLILEAFNNFGATGREKMAALRAALISAPPQTGPSSSVLVDRFAAACRSLAIADWTRAYGNGQPDPNAPVEWDAAKAALLAAVVDPEELRLLRAVEKTTREWRHYDPDTDARAEASLVRAVDALGVYRAAQAKNGGG